MTLLDSATYMPCEHIQKEKEYGIPWRSAFKRELYAFADSTYKRLVGEEVFPETDDPFVFFHKVVKKDCIDAATFDSMSQADFMSMMTENLELLEKTLYQVKALLKQPEITLFDTTKEEVQATLRKEQEQFNPARPNTSMLNSAIRNKM